MKRNNGGSMQRNTITYQMKSDRSQYHASYEHNYDKSSKYDFDFSDDSDIDYDSLVTEDDEPVDNLFSERQQKLLTDSLYASWNTDEIFLACANVGIYERKPKYPIVPDMFLSMGVKHAKDIWKKKNRCYMIGVFGKPPEVVIEVVSNTVGKERKEKLKKYERMDIKYYVIYDPDLLIFKRSNLHAYVLKNGKYVAFPKKKSKDYIWFPDLQVGICVFKGEYQKINTEWLIWCDRNGKVLYPAEIKAKKAETKAKKAETKAKEAETKAKEAETKAKEAETKARNAEQIAEVERKSTIKERKKAEAEKRRAEELEKELALLKKKLLQME